MCIGILEQKYTQCWVYYASWDIYSAKDDKKYFKEIIIMVNHQNQFDPIKDLHGNHATVRIKYFNIEYLPMKEILIPYNILIV